MAFMDSGLLIKGKQPVLCMCVCPYTIMCMCLCVVVELTFGVIIKI